MSRVSRLLNKTVEIWRATQIADGYGGWSETWAPVATVRARLSQPNAYGGNRSSYRADQEVTEISRVIYFEPGTDVKLNDEIRHGSVTTFRNLVPNPSFEVSLDGWSAVGGTLARDTSVAHTGSACARLDASTTGLRYAELQSRFAATEGLECTASAYVRATAGFTACHIDVVFFDAAGTYLGVQRDSDVVLSTDWARAVSTATAPAGAAEGAMNVVFLPDDAAPATGFVDAVQVEQGGTAGMYIDGDQPGCTWDGAAHASTSTKLVGSQSVFDVASHYEPSEVDTYLRVDCTTHQESP